VIVRFVDIGANEYHYRLIFLFIEIEKTYGERLQDEP
jgi:hypothetical protein